MKLLVIPLLVLSVAACGGDSAAAPPIQPTLDAEATANGSTAACEAEWDAFVAEWNALVKARDAAGLPNVVVDGVAYEAYADFAKAKDYPLTYAEHCEN